MNTANRIKGKYKAIDDILNGKETTIKGAFRNINKFIINSNEIGINVTFKEFTDEEYKLEFK